MTNTVTVPDTLFASESSSLIVPLIIGPCALFAGAEAAGEDADVIGAGIAGAFVCSCCLLIAATCSASANVSVAGAGAETATGSFAFAFAPPSYLNAVIASAPTTIDVPTPKKNPAFAENRGVLESLLM